MKKITAVIFSLTLLGTAACSNPIDKRNDARGRGDAPVGSVDDEPTEVIQFPDRFSNVAHKCDGHGHRVYVTTKSDQSRFMAVIADPSCGEGDTETPAE